MNNILSYLTFATGMYGMRSLLAMMEHLQQHILNFLRTPSITDHRFAATNDTLPLISPVQAYEV